MEEPDDVICTRMGQVRAAALFGDHASGSVPFRAFPSQVGLLGVVSRSDECTAYVQERLCKYFSALVRF
jgi:hypothetical protein